MKGKSLFKKKNLNKQIIFYDKQAIEHWKKDCDCVDCLPHRFNIKVFVKNNIVHYDGLLTKKEIDYQRRFFDFLVNKDVEIQEILENKIILEESK